MGKTRATDPEKNDQGEGHEQEQQIRKRTKLITEAEWESTEVARQIQRQVIPKEAKELNEEREEAKE